MSRRLFTAVFALLGAALVAVALVLAGGASTSSGLDPVARAAQATSAQEGAKLAISGHVSVAGLQSPITLRGGGEFDLRHGQGRLTVAVGGLSSALLSKVPGGSLSMEELFVAPNVYVSSPLFSGQLPGGARWVKVDLAQAGQALGVDPSSIMGGETDPSQYLRFLRGPGVSAHVVGHEDIRGVPTTHYAATVDVIKAAEAPGSGLGGSLAQLRQMVARTGTGTLPLEVWVDSAGLVRRVAVSMAEGSGSPHAVVSVTVDYFSFGPIQPVSAPASSEVMDATGQALSQLGAAG